VEGTAVEAESVVTDPGERRSVLAEHPELAKRLGQELKARLATETEESKWGREPAKPAVRGGARFGVRGFSSALDVFFGM
jgi:hypothetical protein